MRDANAVGRLQLKSKLLIGVAGLAAVASGAASAAEATAPAPTPAVPAATNSTPPADTSPKWLPYADFGGGVGSGFVQGKAELFAPVWQDMDSLLFVRLGIGTQTHNDEILNLGLGYRTKVSPDWILGIFGGVDKTHTDLGQNFSQYSLGVEAMSTDWDVRVNGYSSRSHSHALSDTFELYIHDTQIAVLQAQQAALSGFDGEVGYRIFHTDNTDVRLFAGGFVFQNDHHERAMEMGQDFDFKYPTLSGPRGRVEVNVFDLDVLGNQSRVSFDGEVSHDKQRGTTGFAGATLRIPLGAVTGQGAQMLDDLDRRMADPVRRSDNVLTEWQFNRPEPVIIYNGTITSQPTNTLYYVSDTTEGSGSYADPTTINDAAGRDAVNQFVVVTDFGGNVGASNATVHGGETIVAGGQTFSVRGVDSHRVFVHDFAPNSGTPTIVPIHPGDDLLDVEAGGVTIQGLNFGGAFGSAIYGHNIDQLDVVGVNIDGTGGGQNGVFIKQDVSGDLHVHVSDSTINGVGQDGIYVQSDLSDGGTSNTTLEITGSTISGSGNADAIMVGTASNGSTLHQNLVIDPTTLSGGHYAIFVGGTADGGTLDQNVSLTDVTIDGVTNSGIYIYAYSINGGRIGQHITMDNVHITGAFSGGGEGEAVHAQALSSSYYAYGNLITIAAASSSGGWINQSFALNHVIADGAYYDAILLTAYAGNGGITHQYGTMSDVQAINSMYGDGVHVYAYAVGSGAVMQRLTANNLTATGNYDSGVEIGAVAGQLEESGLDASAAASGGPTALVSQYIEINHATLTNNYYGLEAGARAAGHASLLQDVTVSNSNLSNNYVGLYGHILVAGAASGQQIVSLFADTLNNNQIDGAGFTAEALREGFAAQTIYIDGTNMRQNGVDGLYAGAFALEGGDVEQNIGIYYSTLVNNGEHGLELQTLADGYDVGLDSLYYSHVTSNLIVGNSQMSHSGQDGIHIDNAAKYGGQINQFVYLYNDHFNFNGRDGVYERTQALSTGYYGYGLGTAAYSDLYVIDSAASQNGRIGIYVGSYASATFDPSYLFGPTYLIQHVTVDGTHANGNGIGGFADRAGAEGLYSLDIQYVTLSNSTFDGNVLFGAGFQAMEYFGPGSFGAAIQDVTIADSDFSHNGRYGLAGITDASGFQGRAEQNFNIAGSYFDHNGVDGIYLYRHAHDGAYYSYTYGENTYGYPCTAVQGLAGGCAFVRQTVQIVGSEADYNGHDGIYVKSVADNYGAIYSRSGRPYNTPTLILAGTDVSHNGYDGLSMYNNVGAGSYLYQYALAIGSHFDHNGADGIRLTNIVHDGGFVGQYRTTSYTYDGDTYTYTYLYPGSKLTLYGSTANNNGANGIELSNNVSGGSTLYQYVQFINSHADNNHGYGIVSNSYAFSGSELLQGISLYTYVPEGSETFPAVTTTANHNGYGGIQIYGYSYKAAFIVSALKIYTADVSYNGAGSEYGGLGVYMGLDTVGTGIALQSFYSDGSRFANNEGFGVGILDVGYRDIYNSQAVVSTHDLFANNSQGGLGAAFLDEFSNLAIQQLVAASDTFIGNQAGGVIQYAGFDNTYNGHQGSLIEYSYFSGNGVSAVQPESGAASIEIPLGNSIYVGMNATGSFATVEANQSIIGNTILGSGADGIHIQIGSSYGAYVYDYTMIAGNDIENSGGDGINVSLNAYSGGSIFSAYPVGYGAGILISDNTVKNSGTGAYGGDGIHVSLNAAGLGLIMGYTYYSPDSAVHSSEVKYSYLSPFTTSIEGNTVDGAAGNGIYLGTNNSGGRIISEASIGYYEPNNVSNVGGYGIAIHNHVEHATTLALAAVYHNTISNAAMAGIGVTNYNLYGQPILVEHIFDNTISGASYVGIGVANEDRGGSFQNRLRIRYNNIQDAYVGIGISDTGGESYSSLSDFSYITYNTIAYTHLGMGLIDLGAGQSATIKSNTIFGDDTSYGIAAAVYDGGAQTIYCEQIFTKYPLNTMVGIPADQQYSFYNGGGLQTVL